MAEITVKVTLKGTKYHAFKIRNDKRQCLPDIKTNLFNADIETEKEKYKLF